MGVLIRFRFRQLARVLVVRGPRQTAERKGLQVGKAPVPEEILQHQGQVFTGDALVLGHEDAVHRCDGFRDEGPVDFVAGGAQGGGRCVDVGDRDTHPRAGAAAVDRDRRDPGLVEQRRAWEAFKAQRYGRPTLYDEVWGGEILTQPAAIKVAADWARDNGVVSFYDAGDVQANEAVVVGTRNHAFRAQRTSRHNMGVDRWRLARLLDMAPGGLDFSTIIL